MRGGEKEKDREKKTDIGTEIERLESQRQSLFLKVRETSRRVTSFLLTL